MDSADRSIGRRVVALRKARGWNQSELARRAGLAQGYLTLVESGKRANLTVKVAQKLAAALDITLDELLADPQEAAPDVEARHAVGAAA